MAARKTVIRWGAVIVAAAVCAGGVYYYIDRGGPEQQQAQSLSTVVIGRGEIVVSISGTSQFETARLQDITAPSAGTIKTMNLTRSQEVKEGDILLEISDVTLESNLKDAEANLQKLQQELQDLIKQSQSLNLTAPSGGKLILSGNVEVGSNVSTTAKLGTIADMSQFKVTLPFILEEAVQLKAGDEIDLSVEGALLTKVGKVQSVDRQPSSGAGGAKLINVNITVEGDGTLDAGLAVTGSVQLNGREIESQAAGTLEYSKVVSLMPGAAGMIEELQVKNGQYVNQGQKLATIVNDNLSTNIQTKRDDIARQEANLDNLRKRFNDLTVRAPFDGVFSSDFADQRRNVLVSYPAGSSIESGTALGAVASLDTMTLAVQVDELDLPSVAPGLKARVSVDALNGRVLEGEVTQVSTVGVTTNGVTYYDVIIAVPNTPEGDLKYGMTATAEILVQQKSDALMLPIEALQQQRGQRFVSVKKQDGSVEENVPVTIGIRSQTHVEIVEGLNEGDEVVIPVRQQAGSMTQQQANQFRQQFMGGAGGAGGGGFPGGTGGGFPGGGTGGSGGGFPGGGAGGSFQGGSGGSGAGGGAGGGARQGGGR